MKRILPAFFLMVILGFTPELHATHTQGGNFWVESLGGCSYRVYFRDYVDCGSPLYGSNGIATTYTGPFNSPAQVVVSGNGCAAPTATSPWTLESQMDVTPICPQSGLTACDPNTINPPIGGHWERIGYRDYNFCGLGCNMIRIQYSNCCWIGTSSNFTVSPEEYTYIELTPDSLDLGTPVPHSGIPHYIDVAQSSRISLGFTDPDGDSLAYKWADILNLSGQPQSFLPGFSASQPFGPTWVTSLDAETGELYIQEAPGGGAVGTYLLAIDVEEYRNGVLLSTTHVPMEIEIVDYNLLGGPPTSIRAEFDTITMTSQPITGGVWAAPYEITGHVGVPLEVSLKPYDPQGSDTVTMILRSQLPGSQLLDAYTQQVGDTITAHFPWGKFQWTPTTPGRHSFEVQLENLKECGSYVTEQNSFVFTIVVDECDLVADVVSPTDTICSGGAGVFLSAIHSGGTAPVTYAWNTGAAPQQIFVNQGGTYIVQITDAEGCTSIDSLTIEEESAQTGLAGPDTTFCSNGITYLIGEPALPGYTYTWQYLSGGTALSTSAQYAFTPAFPGDSVSLLLTATSNAGCQAIDTVTLTAFDMDSVGITAPDTVCVGDTVLIDVSQPLFSGSTMTVSVDTGAVTVSSNFPSQEVMYTSPGNRQIQVSGTDPCGIPFFASLTIHVAGCVWPGDSDLDGIANNNDLLNIGLSYGNTGSSRANASIAWAAQPFVPWTTSSPGGINDAYADTDGNGLVNDDDTLAIIQNYGLTYLKRDGSEGGPGDPELLVLPVIDSAYIGDTVNLPVILGSSTVPADSIYGLAFTIQYDPTLVDSATAHLSFANSWLGTPGVDLLAIQKDRFVDGEIDVALTRTNHMDRNGFGAIATFSIVMIDDLAGKNGLRDTIQFNITNVTVLDAAGDVRPVYNQPSELVVTDNATGLFSPNLRALVLSPNPTKGAFAVEVPVRGAYDLTVSDLTGRPVRTLTDTRQGVQIDLSDQPSGMYLITLRQGNLIWRGRVVLQE